MIESMVLIPSGEIELRDDRVNQKWKVNIESFQLSKYLITQKLYFSLTHQNPSFFNGENLPVENVSWIDAIKFCNQISIKEGLPEYYSIENESNIQIIDIKGVGYRLPTDAEWQYATKAGTKGAKYGKIESIAWFNGNSEGITHEVGKLEPNPWGLYDMLGNVWEWCWDIYDEKVYGSYRVFRGGGWNDNERGCLATNRRRGHPTFKIDDLGFRIAKTI